MADYTLDKQQWWMKIPLQTRLIVLGGAGILLCIAVLVGALVIVSHEHPGSPTVSIDLLKQTVIVGNAPDVPSTLEITDPTYGNVVLTCPIPPGNGEGTGLVIASCPLDISQSGFNYDLREGTTVYTQGGI